MTLAVATAVAGSRAKGHLVDATDLTWFQEETSTEADSEWETTEVLHGVASMSIDSFVTPVGLKEMLTPIPPRADRAANAGLASIVDREPALHACLTAASALESAFLGQASPRVLRESPEIMHAEKEHDRRPKPTVVCRFRMERTGLEPVTCCLQSNCSPN